MDMKYNNFFTSYLLQGLKFTPWCLDYWVDPSHPDQAALTIGDIGGQVIDRIKERGKRRRREAEHCQEISLQHLYVLVHCFIIVCACICVIPGQCYIFYLGSDLSV